MSADAQALKIVQKITEIVDQTMAPLLVILRSPGWTPTFRAIVLRAVADRCIKFAELEESRRS